MKYACFAVVLLSIIVGCVGPENPLDKLSKPGDRVKTAEKTTVVELDDKSFATEVENKSGIFLIDFNAVWCGPCRKMAPIVEELATEFANKIYVFKVDVDKSPLTSNKYKITSLPSFAFFENGELITVSLGAMKKDDLRKLIQKRIDERVIATFSKW